MKGALRVAMLAAVLAGCAEEPLGYEYTDQFSLMVLQGGSGGVYFLPPLLDPQYDGTFVTDRDPVVVVCAGASDMPCADPVAVFDMVLDAGEEESRVVRVSVEDEHYIVNWKADGLPGGLYRIFVTEAGAMQAFVDVALSKGGNSSSARRLRTYGMDVAREFNGTLPIAFRMEERAPVVVTGLRAQYYDWRATALDFNAAPLILERVDSVIDFLDPTGTADVLGLGQNDHIMARWTGTLIATAPGYEMYTFCVTADDGARLWIDDILFVNSWVDQDDTTRCSSYWMTEGTTHPVRVEWYHVTGGPAVQLYWQTRDGIRTIIPPSALRPN